MSARRSDPGSLDQAAAEALDRARERWSELRAQREQQPAPIPPQAPEPLETRRHRLRGEYQRAYRQAPAELRAEAEAFIGTIKPADRADFRAELGCALAEGGPERFGEVLGDAIDFRRSIEANRATWEREAREREAQRLAEREARRAERQAAIAAAIERGEPIPARWRPVGNRCAVCRRPLRDPESARLGIGPECRRREARQC